jgi:2-polyprenyl-3-methyl-5-hydroxy-6-metoxy-1,4-benzoquinol methylase
MKRCPICQSTLKSFGKVRTIEILKCSKCGFGLTKNLKAQDSIYHRDETYINEDNLFKNIFQKRVNIIDKLIKPGKVLEVGCSTGLMLSLLKDRGWEVTGVEISKTAGEVAEKRGIKIYQQKFEKIKFDQKFDLIIFNHTLEHVEDFKTVLVKSRALLKPKGYLYVDLPNFGSFSAGLLKTKWPLLLPLEHLWHFNLKALIKLLQDLEFKIVFVNRSSGIWDYQNPTRGVLYSLTHFKKRFFKEFFTALPSLLVSKMSQGSDLMVIARKR